MRLSPCLVFVFGLVVTGYSEVPSKPSVSLCDLCTIIVQTVAGIMDEEEDNIIAAVDAQCESLGPASSICKAIADEYVPDIIKWLEEEQTEKEICEKLSLCDGKTDTPRKLEALVSLVPSVEQTPSKSKTSEVLEVLHPRAVKGIMCDMCQTITKIVVDLLETDKTEPEIDAIVNKMCDEMAGSLSRVCKKMADEYVHEIIEYLDSGAGADEICKLLHLCSTVEVPEPAIQQPRAVGGIMCDMCQTITKIVVHLLGLDKTEPEIDVIVNKECDKLAGSLSRVCKKMADEYVHEIIEYLDSGAGADEICKLLHLCSN